MVLWLRGVPGGAWGGPREAPEAPRGGPGRLRKHMKFSEGVWGGSRGTPGMILVVWGGPRDRPGRWECEYFVGFQGIFAEVWFFMFLLIFYMICFWSI